MVYIPSHHNPNAIVPAKITNAKAIHIPQDSAALDDSLIICRGVFFVSNFTAIGLSDALLSSQALAIRLLRKRKITPSHVTISSNQGSMYIHSGRDRN